MTTYQAKVFIGRELQPRASYILTADDEQTAREAAEAAVSRQFPRAKHVEILVVTVED